MSSNNMNTATNLLNVLIVFRGKQLLGVWIIINTNTASTEIIVSLKVCRFIHCISLICFWSKLSDSESDFSSKM